MFRAKKHTPFAIMVIRTVLACSLTLSMLVATVQAQSNSSTAQQSFDKWLAGFKQRALREGISKQTLEQAFKGVFVDDKVLTSDRKQPEFRRTFFQYLNRAVSSTRVSQGQSNFRRYQRTLKSVEQKYGIPAEVLTAFWGMETNYGGYTGNLSIIQSLATLAYDPRRSDFFSKELIAALKILDRGHVNLSDMKGSWAGAMGQVQFMPSNYLKYAIDGDGNGKINLWKSLPDAFHSAGNFLQTLGWNPDETWGYEVQLPKNFDYYLADGKVQKSVAQWNALGIKGKDPTGKTQPNTQAHLILPSDYRGPAFLVFDNFKVIKRWNNSNNYALAVGYLSQRIKQGPKLSKTQPANDKNLSLTELKELQNILNRLGYSAGVADGIAGSKTRNALRAFQKSQNLPADGYPSAKILHKLRQLSQTAER
ncbi:lytic murein transglycosylase [Thiomicrorhabdus indica]|uniref:lytic murein transglycosylase n=1 Tax=Thiomicrorhabdus indica TaxID=2267253 RepID=UPI002AA69734|nr:lytic murein transglycosylase [Thiomicrorhabdus indica]